MRRASYSRATIGPLMTSPRLINGPLNVTRSILLGFSTISRNPFIKDKEHEGRDQEASTTVPSLPSV